jgi:hypothetical protein
MANPLVTPQELAAIKSGAQALMAGAANAPGIAQTGAGLYTLYQKAAPASLGGTNAPIGTLYAQNRAAQQQAYQRALAAHPDIARAGKDIESTALGGLVGAGLGEAVGMAPGALGRAAPYARDVASASEAARNELPSMVPAQPETQLEGRLPETLYDLKPGQARQMSNEQWKTIAARTPIAEPYESAKTPWGNLTLEQRAQLRQIIRETQTPPGEAPFEYGKYIPSSPPSVQGGPPEVIPESSFKYTNGPKAIEDIKALKTEAQVQDAGRVLRSMDESGKYPVPKAVWKAFLDKEKSIK